MRQKLGLTTTLGFRPAVFLGLLALTILSVTCWEGVAQAQVYGNVSNVTTGTTREIFEGKLVTAGEPAQREVPGWGPTSLRVIPGGFLLL